MIEFAFRGTIAHIDETIPGEPSHPTIVLILEVGDTFSRVIVPEAVLNAGRELLCVARPVHLFGEVRDSRWGPRHIATELRLLGSPH